MCPQPPARQARPSAPTPSTLLPVPEITPIPGCASVAVAQAATTSLTTSQSSERAARTCRATASVSVPASAITSASSSSPSMPALPIASSAASSSAWTADRVPTASSLLGPPCPRCSVPSSRSSSAASVFVAPPSIPSTKRAYPPPSAFTPGGTSSGGSWTSGARCTHGSSHAGGGACPRPGLAAHIAHLQQLAAASADAMLAELAAAALVAQHDRRPRLGRGVAVAPAQQLDDHRPQVQALAGQPVFMADRPLLVGNLLEDPFGDEPVEARGEHVAGDAETLLHLVEAPSSEEYVAQHENRPALAH